MKLSTASVKNSKHVKRDAAGEKIEVKQRDVPRGTRTREPMFHQTAKRPKEWGVSV
jgi:hypothetical protein